MPSTTTSRIDDELAKLRTRWEHVERSIEPEQAEELRPRYVRAMNILLDARNCGEFLTLDDALEKSHVGDEWG